MTEAAAAVGERPARDAALGTAPSAPPRAWSEPGPRGFPTWYAVRDVRIEPNVVLAPMEGVTDVLFRSLIRRLSAPGLTYTEFIASAALGAARGKVWRAADVGPGEHPIAFQIYGREPAEMARAARLLEDHGATIIDINMGCPSKRVCAHSGGSALMREPDLAAGIVRAVRRAISVPLSVKMRSGFAPGDATAPELAWRCQEEGAEAITVHWRTRADGYQGQRDVAAIAETVRRVSLPVIGNGDIVDLASAQAMLAETGCHGLMVGRGALRDPWLIREIANWLNGRAAPAVSAGERLAVLAEHVAELGRKHGEGKLALGRSKQLASQFCRALPRGDELRAQLLRAPSLAAVLAALAEHGAACRDDGARRPVAGSR